MAGGSNKHMIGLIRVGKGPERSESKMIAEIQGSQVDVQERTYWEKDVDKQTGSYTKFTGKDKVVSGERFVEKSTGLVTRMSTRKALPSRLGTMMATPNTIARRNLRGSSMGKTARTKPSPTTPTQNTTKNTTSISSPLILAGDIIVAAYFLAFGI